MSPPPGHALTTEASHLLMHSLRHLGSLLLLALAQLLGSAHSFGALVAEDDFEGYDTGAFGGQGESGLGWGGPWVPNPITGLNAEIFDTSTTGSLNFTPNGGTYIGGGTRAVEIYPPAGAGTDPKAGLVASRLLETPATGTLWVGYIVRWTTGAFNTGDTFVLNFNDSPGDLSRGFNVGYRGLPTTYGVIARQGGGVPVAGAFSTFASSTNTTARYLLVRLEKVDSATYNSVTVWISPSINALTEKPNGDLRLSGVSSGVEAISAISVHVEGLRSPDVGSNGNDRVRFDSLAVGEQFDDIIRNPVLGNTGRPFIWVRDSDKAAISSRIATQSWANSVRTSLVNRSASNLNSHGSSRDTFLRQLPVLWTASPPRMKTMPTYASSEVRTPLVPKLDFALDAAVLYYLTGDERYARAAGDILHNVVKTLAPVATSTEAGNGGWVIQNDLLLEARVVGTQLAIVYDFLRVFLETNVVYDVETATTVPFDFSLAQAYFRTYFRLVRDHGQKESNWSALMSTCMLNNLLALDDATERAAALQFYLVSSTARQASLAYDYRFYGEPGSLWPESLQYATEVAQIRTGHMVLLERYDPTLKLIETYPNLPWSLTRPSYLRYPNGERISFGDGPRTYDPEAYFDYEVIYQHAKARGMTAFAAHFGARIADGINAGLYNRASLPSYEALGTHNELLRLLWFADTVTEPATPLVLPRTDTLPFAGIALQRNLSPTGNPLYGLMGFVGGGAHVHSHASGMSMELYGLGQVLGAKSGKGTYQTEIHENFYRVFASNNTVIVNGASRGSGGWEGVGINTVQVVGMEPAVGAPGVSPLHSFTTSTFRDDKGDLAEASQQRTLGIIRTSPTTGFYVDLFRSDSSLSGEYHDYVYRNVGDSVSLLADTGAPLVLNPAPDRFQSDIGDTYKQPGWRYFEDTEVTGTTSLGLRARFVATLPAGETSMMLHMPGSPNREIARVTSPPILHAPSPYWSRRAPTVVIRKKGSAWDQPFAAVFEPTLGAGGLGTVQRVSHLLNGSVVVGLKVETLVAGRSSTHHVFVHTGPTNTTVLASGIAFTGRYAVATDHGDGSGSLYLGEGSHLSMNGHGIRTVSGGATQAYLTFAPGSEPVLTANAPMTVESPTAPPLDQWRSAWFGTTSSTGDAAPSANPDGDRWTNAEEYALGLSPITPEEDALVAPAREANDLVLRFVARAAEGIGYAGLTRTYVLEEADRPGTWSTSPAASPIVATGQEVTLRIPITAETRMYRLNVKLE